MATNYFGLFLFSRGIPAYKQQVLEVRGLIFFFQKWNVSPECRNKKKKNRKMLRTPCQAPVAQLSYCDVTVNSPMTSLLWRHKNNCLGKPLWSRCKTRAIAQHREVVGPPNFTEVLFISISSQRPCKKWNFWKWVRPFNLSTLFPERNATFHGAFLLRFMDLQKITSKGMDLEIWWSLNGP